MYPSKGNNPYGQQPYGSSQAYGQIPTSGYSGNPAVSSDTDMSAYRAYSSQTTQYGGQYATVYGSSTLSSGQQVGGVSGKEAVSSSNLQGQSVYSSVLTESSKFSSGTLGSSLGIAYDDYLSATNRAYTQKPEQFSSMKTSDYALADRRHYGEPQSAFVGRELQSDTARRYLDSVLTGASRHQVELHEQIDQASLLRQQQMLKVQSLQSGSDMRQDEYYAPRTVPSHHGSQDINSYSGRMDADPHGLSVYGATSYGGQVAASILGGAPRRNVDDLYVPGPSNATYGVSLPIGRDYAAGKGILGTPHESTYKDSVLSRGHATLGVTMVDERNDDRSAYRRELEVREEERRREIVREREREREREHERERERERERQRERERERQRERERLRERHDKERERERKHIPDARRERTPSRATRDRRGSSLMKDEKVVCRVTPHRATPHREAVHRHHSPVKEKKREYICKVYPFCIVEVERDYLSLSKRYPRLAIAGDFSKAIVNWPRETLNLSLHTPVSFEHDFLDVEDKSEVKGQTLWGESLNSKGVKTVWNAKIILMSGVSSEAFTEICFGKDTDERIIHYNNILKFAVLKKDRSFLAIGGPPLVNSDGDPQIDDSSLIQTAIRNLNHLIQLDLHSCLHWNRFLEIHYDRVGKDGLFSHKEITVFFVPNLSECLPSLDQWRMQWLTHKKEVAEREQIALKEAKKCGERKEPGQGEKSQSKTVNNESDKILNSDDNLVKDETAEKKTQDPTTDGVSGCKKTGSEGKEPVSDNLEQTEDGEGKSNEKNDNNDGSVDLSTENKKTTKKKIVKKVVKGKTTIKKASATTVEDTSTRVDENFIATDNKTENKHGNTDQEDPTSADQKHPTTGKKKIIRKVSTGKSAQKEDTTNSSDAQIGTKIDNEEVKVINDKEEIEKGHDGTSTAPDADVKTVGKKKIIRRVIKRKISTAKLKDANANKDAEGNKGDIKENSENKENDVADANTSEKKTEGCDAPFTEKDHLDAKTMANEKDKNECRSVDSHSKPEKGGSKTMNDSESLKLKNTKKDSQDGKEWKKDEKEGSKDGKLDSHQKSHSEKEKGGSREPPKHPGFILKAHRTKGSKLRPISLSLDGLLDYNDKDIEESTFELSLFAEAFNEMLQFKMGCQLLSFLEKLHKRYIVKKNNRKRQRDEKSDKGIEKEKMPPKHPKPDESSPVTSNSTKFEMDDASKEEITEDMNVDETMKVAKGDVSGKTNDANEGEGGSASGGLDGDKTEGETVDDEMDEEEDPEEIIEEEEADADARSNGVQEDVNMDKPEAEPEITTSKNDDSKIVNEIDTDEAAKNNEKSDKEDKQSTEKDSSKDEKKDSVKDAQENSTKDAVVDKELLQAFRFFDRNNVGYIKVQDLRCILHNLGKFLTHKDVKELAQSALVESNSARDDRIFYKKLVRMTLDEDPLM